MHNNKGQKPEQLSKWNRHDHPETVQSLRELKTACKGSPPVSPSIATAAAAVPGRVSFC